MFQSLAYASADVGNITNYNEAINQLDAIKFAKAIIKEVYGHMVNGDLELVLRHAFSVL